MHRKQDTGGGGNIGNQTFVQGTKLKTQRVIREITKPQLSDRETRKQVQIIVCHSMINDKEIGR